MSIEQVSLGDALWLGIGATLVMDLWALFLKRVFDVPSLNYRLVGRWAEHMAYGTFSHAHIAKARQMKGEVLTGWLLHYLIGIVFAAGLLGFVGTGWLTAPTLLPALAVGVGTVVFPFFIMQPAFGFGIAASKTPAPAIARLKSLMSHASFGVGLFIAAQVMAAVR